MPFLSARTGAIAASSRYFAPGIDFDGSSDWLELGGEMAGIADGKQFTFSGWIFSDATYSSGSPAALLSNELQRFAIKIGNNDKLAITGANTSGTGILDVAGNTAIGSAGWRNILISMDLSDTGKRHVYMNDSSDIGTVTTYTDANIDFTGIDWGVMALETTGSEGTQKFNGGVADLWFDDSYLDLSVSGNRRKFIDSTGKPVALGALGELPTGSRPLLFLSGGISSFAANRGTGGGFTTHGTLTARSTSPSV